MNKKVTKPVVADNNVGIKEPEVSFWKKAQTKLTPVADWTLKIIGAIFIVATSFMYVRDWLQTNQVNHDFSLAGGIIVVTVALYLVVRKR